MKRLWRSVLILAVCFAAVVGLRIYLKNQLEIAKSDMPSRTIEMP